MDRQSTHEFVSDVISITESEMNSETPVSQKLALLIYLLSSLLVINAVFLADDMLELCTMHQYSTTKRVASDGFFAWDAVWYDKIATGGYQYQPGRNSSIAFFPAFPLMSWCVSFLTGIPVRPSLLLVSHVCLALTFVTWVRYLDQRNSYLPTKETPPQSHSETRETRQSQNENTAAEPRGRAAFPVLEVLLAFALFPTTFWFRMAYTESMFALFILLTLQLIESRSSFWKCCLMAGASTAVRSVGVALIPVLFVEACSRWRETADWRAFLWLPLSTWGLITFILYQSLIFGEPLAFIKIQQTWQMRQVPSVKTRIIKEFTLQPLRDVYDPECSRCYWGGKPPTSSFILNLWFANPLYFFFTVGLVGIGWQCAWLTRSELILSAGLLLIPYCSHGYNCMASFARYSSAVLPAYIVMGKLLQNMNRTFAILIGIVSVTFLLCYSALFANWYWAY